MSARELGRNGPCPCGSGRKYRQCCWLRRFDGRVAEPALLGDGANARPKPSPPRQPPPPKPKNRVGVDYTFSDGFGTGQVRYSFEVEQQFLLTNGLIVTADKVEVGMQFFIEDGMVAVITAVKPPKAWPPPPPGKDEYGNSAKRIVGTVKYSGHYPVVDLVVGDLHIRATPGHQFYSVHRRGWVDAGSLVAGEYLQSEQGQVVSVTHVSPARFEPIDLYNVELEDFHTYFVGRPDGTSVWSHNGLEGGCGIPNCTARV